MTYVSQKTLRAALVTSLKTITLLADETGGSKHVLGYFEPNPQGISPFVCVDSAGKLFDLPDDETNLTPARFAIGVWQRRDDGNGIVTATTAQSAEDQLDDLALSIANVLRLNYPNSKFLDFPRTDYEEIEGLQYKFLFYFVEIDN
jgi:hypothetical protein